MDAIAVTSIAVLVVVFAVAAGWNVNVGVLAFPAAFLVASIAGLGPDEIAAGFPVDLFILVAGVTYLFAILTRVGSIDLLTTGILRLVRGRVVALPWALFALAALICGLGALVTAAIAIVAPIGLKLARAYRINPMLCGLMVVHGATAGGYSPLSPYGVVTASILGDAGLPQPRVELFVNHLVVNIVVCVVVFVLFGGLGLRRRVETAEAPVDDGSGGPPRRLGAVAGLLSVLVLMVCVLVLRTDPGLTAFAVALAMTLMFTRADKDLLTKLPWPVLLMVTGILTYIGVLKEVGTLDALADAVGDGNAVLALLALCYIAAVTSAFASSVSVLGAVLPLAVPLLHGSGLGVVGTVTALSVSAVLVDASPLSSGGALVLANAGGDAEAQHRRFRQLLTWGAAMTAVGPGVAWLVFVVLP